MDRYGKLLLGFAGVVAAALVIVLTTMPQSALPHSEKMSDGFKQAAYDSWIGYHEVGVCVLPSEVKPVNTADEQVRRLFDQCVELDSKRRDIAADPLAGEDQMKEYRKIWKELKAVESQIDQIFKDHGYEDASVIIDRKINDQVRRSVDKANALSKKSHK